jgi:hypothetical protein
VTLLGGWGQDDQIRGIAAERDLQENLAMRIEAPPDIVELRITEIVPSHLPAAGDLRLEMQGVDRWVCRLGVMLG